MPPSPLHQQKPQMPFMSMLVELPHEYIHALSACKREDRDILLADGNCAPLAIAHFTHKYNYVGLVLRLPSMSSTRMESTGTRSYISVLDALADLTVTLTPCTPWTSCSQSISVEPALLLSFISPCVKMEWSRVLCVGNGTTTSLS